MRLFLIGIFTARIAHMAAEVEIPTCIDGNCDEAMNTATEIRTSEVRRSSPVDGGMRLGSSSPTPRRDRQKAAGEAGRGRK